MKRSLPGPFYSYKLTAYTDDFSAPWLNSAVTSVMGFSDFAHRDSLFLFKSCSLGLLLQEGLSALITC